MEVHVVMCTHDHSPLILRSLPQICSIMNWALRLPHPITTHTLKLVLLPFLTMLAHIHSTSDAASKGIGPPHVLPSNLLDLNAPSLYLGRITGSKPLTAFTSVSATMSGIPA